MLETHTEETSIHTVTLSGNKVRKPALHIGVDKNKVILYIKKYLVLLLGLIIMAFGVSFSINAELGTSPVSSIPYVLSIISPLSVGVTTIIVNTVIVLLQIVILRKKFRPIRLLQIPVCTIFGLLIDLTNIIIRNVVPENYATQWLLCVVGIFMVALGVSFEMAANVITLAGEGLAQPLCETTRLKFGYAKVICDVSFVVIALVLSFAFSGKLQGVREGTAAAAVCVGLIAKKLNKLIFPLAERFYGKHLRSKTKDETEVS